MKPRSRRAHPKARAVAWALVAAGLLAAGADWLSRVRSAAFISPGAGGVLLSDGALQVMLVLTRTTRIVQPAPGWTWGRQPAGYGVASQGTAVEGEFAGFARTIRDQGTGKLQWVMLTGRPSWFWHGALPVGIVGLLLTRRLRAGICQSCGYALEGLPAGTPRCPECGTDLGPGELTPPAARP